MVEIWYRCETGKPINFRARTTFVRVCITMLLKEAAVRARSLKWHPYTEYLEHVHQMIKDLYATKSHISYQSSQVNDGLKNSFSQYA